MMAAEKEKTGKPQRWQSAKIDPTRWAIGLALLVAILACLASPFLASQPIRQSFPGFLLEPTMVISAVGNDDWPGKAQGLDHPWRVVAADGIPMDRPADLSAYLQSIPLGTEVQYTVENMAGRQLHWPQPIPSSLMPTSDVGVLFWGPYLVALSYLVCGVWVFWPRRDEPAGQACVLLCVGVALSLALLFDTLTKQYLSHLWTAALPLCAAAGVHLALVFPEPLPPLRRIRGLAWLPYLLAAGLTAWSEFAYASDSSPWAYFSPWRWGFIAISAGIILLLGRLSYTRYFSRSGQVRQQARTVLLGGLLAFLPIAAGLSSVLLRFNFAPYLPWMILCLPIFPLTLAYAIAREHLLDVDRVVSRGLAYSLLVLLEVALYVGMVYLIRQLAPEFLRADDTMALALLVIVAALLVSPLHRRLRQLVDRLLYRERVNFRRTVSQFGHSLSQVIDLPELSQLIIQRIAEALHLDAASLYLFDQRSGTYHLYKSLDSLPGQAPVFAETDPFIQRLRVSSSAVYRYHRSGGWLHSLPPEEKKRVDRMFGLVFLPLSAQSHLVGWLSLGAQLSREAYSSEDLELLNALADRAAVAIENARLFAERERRLTELAVLNEIGQAINSALSLDQVLSTIYEETGRLMDTTNFSIALYDPEKDLVSFRLYVQDGHILPAWSRRQGRGLTEYILRTRQPLLIAERVVETTRSMADVEVVGRPAMSWLGVPIIIDDQAIGVIAVQSTQTKITYDIEDLDSLNAIANQAAIAIKNARLYEMIDQALSRRLEEITILDDFARALTTVALDPTQVAEQTLWRAVDSLQASRGTLACYDETRRRFRLLARLRCPAHEDWTAVWNALLPDLLASRGTCLYRDDTLSSFALPQGRAPLQAICPLVRENKLLALLHLGLPAEAQPDLQRQRFLRHMADHAAIALENALLYERQVEQSQLLECRTQHLTDMLNLSKTLRANVPLDQVLRHVVETARGIIDSGSAIISLAEGEEPSSLRRAAGTGMDDAALQRLQAESVPLDRYEQVIKSATRISQSYVVQMGQKAIWEEIYPYYHAIHPAFAPQHAQAPEQPCLLLVPLRGTGNRLRGMLDLYHMPKQWPPDQDTIEILEILASQAAIAIENAHLYQALHRANEAKSEFLSIVAHELQVPMRAIWGYADLLMQDPASRDESTQRGFLRVIQSNIGRLDALVNDLLEVSRMEAGKVQLSPAPLYLREVVLESIATFRPQLEQKGLALHLDIPEDLPPITADWDRLSQIMHNLISNAYKYTPAPGDISIAVRMLRQAEDLNGTGPAPNYLRCPCVCVSVRDSGIGLSPQEKKKLFSRFFRSEQPLVRQESGTGLGLYLVNLLVEAHQGQIWVESEPGQGSTFHIALPLSSRAGQSLPGGYAPTK